MDDRTKKRLRIQRLADLLINHEGKHRELTRTIAETVRYFFLHDDADRELKDEALWDAFTRLCDRNREPKTPTWNDVLFLSRVTERSVEEILASLSRLGYRLPDRPS